MKTALINDQLIAANPDAPNTAACPYCRHPVILRQRFGTWYWRHQRGTPADCQARARPVPRTKANPEPPTDHFRLSPIPVNNLNQLVAASTALGANTITLPNTPITITLTGPGVVILAACENEKQACRE
jgi:hypothetical protein